MNLAITMLMIYMKLHTVLFVLLYRDQTLFGHHGPSYSNLLKASSFQRLSVEVTIPLTPRKP